MGANRKFILQGHLQEAVWRTIMRGKRPPSVKWEKRDQPTARVVREPTKPPKQTPTSVARRDPMPPDVRWRQLARGWTSSKLYSSRKERTTKFFRHPGRPSESMSPGTRAASVGTHQVHEVVLVKEAETCRGGTSIEGQRSFGRAHCGTGEGRNIVRRQGAEVAGVGSGRERCSVSIHSATTISRVSAELSRMQGIAPLDPTADVNVSMVSDLPHMKSRVDPTASGHDRRRTENTIGSHGRTRTGFQQQLSSALDKIRHEGNPRRRGLKFRATSQAAGGPAVAGCRRPTKNFQKPPE